MVLSIVLILPVTTTWIWNLDRIIFLSGRHSQDMEIKANYQYLVSENLHMIYGIKREEKEKKKIEIQTGSLYEQDLN